MVLFSESGEGLQCLLNELYSSCNTLKMHVNAESKKKNVIFRYNGKLDITLNCKIVSAGTLLMMV